MKNLGTDAHDLNTINHFVYRGHLVVFGGEDKQVRVYDAYHKQKFGTTFDSIEHALLTMEQYFATMLSENCFA